MTQKASKKSPKKNLKLRRKLLADLPTKKAAGIRGGSKTNAPPYVPVGPCF